MTIIDVTVLEPIEVTSWLRKHPEAKLVTPKGSYRKTSKPRRGKGAHRKQGAKAQKTKTARQPRRPAPWPESAGTVGVYGILHRPTNSIYIGYTADKNGFKWRWKRHKAQLFVAKTHHCAPFQKFVNENRLKPKDFDLIILSSYPSRPRTQTLANKLVKEEVEFWDRAEAAGFTMLCERPLGVTRKYERVNKHD